MPALLTTASIRDRPDSARLTWSSSAMSQIRLFSNGDATRSIAVMVAPSAWAACAIASPSPEAAPVTTTCLLEKRMPRHRRSMRGVQRSVFSGAALASVSEHSELTEAGPSSSAKREGGAGRVLTVPAGGGYPLSRQPACVIAGQEDGNLGDVFGLADA